MAKKRMKTSMAEIVNDVLEEAGVGVEPEPVLPDVSKGDWHYREDDSRIYTSRGDVIAERISIDEDGEVMAGSKSLVELVIKDLRERYERGNLTYEVTSDMIRAIVDQLGVMGVDVSGFKEEE